MMSAEELTRLETEQIASERALQEQRHCEDEILGN
jgi:hypothetical protein